MASTAPVAHLEDHELPPIFHVADRSSIRAQNHFLFAITVRLVSIVSAGAFGLATWKFDDKSADWAGVLATLFFIATVIVETYLLKTRPERTWYEGRAAAESVKTLSWRYSVGGDPFNIGERTEQDIDALFLRQLEAIISTLKDLDISPPTSAGEQITDLMRLVRSKSLDERKQAYELGRVAEQQGWYQRKAGSNDTLAIRWTIAVLCIEIIGVIAAVLKAVGIVEGDFLIFAGAVAAAMAAWLQTKQHRTLATAYGITALELASVRSKIRWQKTESDWAKFVNDAEEAFSREHTLWKASRGAQSI
jgi:hypothetical protein